MRLTCIAVAVVFLAAPAIAQDRAACGAGLVCASDPATVIAAMAKANLKPKLSKDGEGDPMIESAHSAAYQFEVYFYGCEKAKNCDSLRFQVLFDKEEGANAVLANKWNAGHRFVHAAVKDDGRFTLSYDVPTIGGMNARNFADVLDWWSSMLGEAGDFFAKELKSATPAQ